MSFLGKLLGTLAGPPLVPVAFLHPKPPHALAPTPTKQAALPANPPAPASKFAVIRDGRTITTRDEFLLAVQAAKTVHATQIMDLDTNKLVWRPVEVKPARPKGQVARIKAEIARRPEAKSKAALLREFTQTFREEEWKSFVFPATPVWIRRGMMRRPDGQKLATDAVGWWDESRLKFSLSQSEATAAFEKRKAEKEAAEAPEKERLRREKETLRLAKEATAKAAQEEATRQQAEKAEKQRLAKEAAAEAKAKAAKEKESAELVALEKQIAAEDAAKRKKAEEEEALLLQMIAEEEEAAKNPPKSFIEEVSSVKMEAAIEDVVLTQVFAKAPPGGVNPEMPTMVQDGNKTFLLKTDEAGHLVEDKSTKVDKSGRGKCLTCGMRRKLTQGFCSEHQAQQEATT